MPHPIISVPKDPTIAACGQRNCHKQRCFKKQEIGRTWGQTQTNMGADANAHGGRCECAWEQMRMHTAPRSLTSIGSRFPNQQVFGHDTHIAIGRQTIEK